MVPEVNGKGPGNRTSCTGGCNPQSWNSAHFQLELQTPLCVAPIRRKNDKYQQHSNCWYHPRVTSIKAFSLFCINSHCDLEQIPLPFTLGDILSIKIIKTIKSTCR